MFTYIESLSHHIGGLMSVVNRGLLKGKMSQPQVRTRLYYITLSNSETKTYWIFSIEWTSTYLLMSYVPVYVISKHERITRVKQDRITT